MEYIKAAWNESRGDQYDDWGHSMWYLELDENKYPTRQIEIYSNGNRLRYHLNKLTDKYGQLGDQPILEEEGWGEIISNVEFKKEWIIEAFNDE